MGCQTSVDNGIERHGAESCSVTSQITNTNEMEFQIESNEKSVTLNVRPNGKSGGGFTLRYGIISHRGYYPDDIYKPNQVKRKHF